MFYNTNYAFDGWIPCAPAFFCCFLFLLKKKAGLARKMMWVFILFILLVKKLHSGQTPFLTAQFCNRRAYFIKFWLMYWWYFIQFTKTVASFPVWFATPLSNALYFSAFALATLFLSILLGNLYFKVQTNYSGIFESKLLGNFHFMVWSLIE